MRMRPAEILAATLSAALAWLPRAAIAETLPKERVELLEAAIAAEMKQREIPGLSIAVATGNEIRYNAAFGLADVENDVPAKPETAYRTASVCKPMTAVLVLQLAEVGQIDLNAPVQKYIPSFPEKPWSVTPRLLLAHLGGIRNYSEGEIGSTRHYSSVEEALSVFKDDPLVNEPGTQFLYSTYGFNLLGAVVEGASGQSYLEVLKNRVLVPAEMTRTRDDDDQAIIPNRAQGYVRTASGELRNSILSDTSNKVPGGGLVSVALDVARFGIALQSGKLLSGESWKAMLTPQRLRSGKVTGAGLGLYVSKRAGRREAWHSGGQPRVSTILYLEPEAGVVVTILCNLEGLSQQLLEFARQLADIAMDRAKVLRPTTR